MSSRLQTPLLTSGRVIGSITSTADSAGLTGIGTANKAVVTVGGVDVGISIVVGARPVRLIAYWGIAVQGTAGDGAGIGIVDTADTSTLLCQGTIYCAVTAAQQSIRTECLIAAGAGAKTYKVYGWVLVGGTLTLKAGAQNPARFYAIEE